MGRNPAIKISSMRKSLLSALFGIYAPLTHFDLDASLGSLGIDDDPPLTTEEKQATVRMLLEARSGVYHGYVAGTPAMREGWPKRGSHSPGSFWYYNNWDFNALGLFVLPHVIFLPFASSSSLLSQCPSGPQPTSSVSPPISQINRCTASRRQILCLR